MALLRSVKVPAPTSAVEPSVTWMSFPFAAGLTISALDVELCDCFLDYGQATAELFPGSDAAAVTMFPAGAMWEKNFIVGSATPSR